MKMSIKDTVAAVKSVSNRLSKLIKQYEIIGEVAAVDPYQSVDNAEVRIAVTTLDCHKIRFWLPLPATDDQIAAALNDGLAAYEESGRGYDVVAYNGNDWQIDYGARHAIHPKMRRAPPAASKQPPGEVYAISGLYIWGGSK